MTLELTLARTFLSDHPAEAAQALERMAPEHRADVVRELGPEAAPALGRMVPAAAADCLGRLTAAEAGPALSQLPVDRAIDLLRRLPEPAAQGLIASQPPHLQESLRRVLRYPGDTAGGLMDPMVLALPDDISVAEARLRLRRQAQGLLHYLFVVDRSGLLVGVLDIPELMQARPRESIRAVMHQQVERLPAWTPAAAVRTHAGWQSFHALPVVDDDGHLLGAIRYQVMRRLERDLQAGGGPEPTAVTVGALGELFHLGLAGIVDGVATTASPREARQRRGATATGGVR